MTPTQTILDAALAPLETVDATGRTLCLRRPTALDRLRLFKAAGAGLSNNEHYLGMAMLAFTVTAIDGIPVPQPGSEQQIEAAVERLGDAGLAAVAAVLAPDDMEGLATADPGN